MGGGAEGLSSAWPIRVGAPLGSQGDKEFSPAAARYPGAGELIPVPLQIQEQKTALSG